MKRVENGDFVKVCYSVKMETGEVVEQSQPCETMEVHVGAGEVIQGLENALIGMAPKEKKTFTLTPDEAYGERDEHLERTILRSNFPEDFEPRVGEIIALQTPKGEQLPAVIKGVENGEVTVDFNHPLAGRSLSFEVEVAEISNKPSQAPSACASGCCCS